MTRRTFIAGLTFILGGLSVAQPGLAETPAPPSHPPPSHPPPSHPHRRRTRRHRRRTHRRRTRRHHRRTHRRRTRRTRRHHRRTRRHHRRTRRRRTRRLVAASDELADAATHPLPSVCARVPNRRCRRRTASVSEPPACEQVGPSPTADALPTPGQEPAAGTGPRLRRPLRSRQGGPRRRVTTQVRS